MLFFFFDNIKKNYSKLHWNNYENKDPNIFGISPCLGTNWVGAANNVYYNFEGIAAIYMIGYDG